MQLKHWRGNKKCVVMGGLVAITLFLIWEKGEKGSTAMWYEEGPGWEQESAKERGTWLETWSGQMRRDTDDSKEETESCMKIALTFDDGPHPFYTEQLLDGLKERGVHVTFFVTGEHAQLHPEVIKRMQEEGHLIGNHTYDHLQLNSENREEFKNQLVRTNEIIESITGEEVQYVRPPYGTWDKKLESELSMFPVLWTIDPQDWCSTNVEGIRNKVISNAEENGIILMHDYYASTITAALEVVDELKAQGYEFVTVEEILFD